MMLSRLREPQCFWFGISPDLSFCGNIDRDADSPHGDTSRVSDPDPDLHGSALI